MVYCQWSIVNGQMYVFSESTDSSGHLKSESAGDKASLVQKLSSALSQANNENISDTSLQGNLKNGNYYD